MTSTLKKYKNPYA